jgi:hypothetical protein
MRFVALIGIKKKKVTDTIKVNTFYLFIYLERHKDNVIIHLINYI